MKIVMIDGDIVELGNGERGASGLELAGLVLGSEGLLGVIAEATLALVPIPETRRLLLLAFNGISDAVACAMGIQSDGIGVTAIELLDQSAIQACEDCKPTDLPTGAAAVLIVEIDGSADTAASASDAARLVASNFGATEQREVLVAGQIDAHLAGI